MNKPTFYEFFAGGGMARAGLGEGWTCLFANDIDRKKTATYAANWGDKEIVTEDVRKLAITDLPQKAHLVWGSFPCQDLSLAGTGSGLKGDRSGTFWPFWNLIRGLIADGRAPEIIVLENVLGTLTSDDGKDFATICDALRYANYQFGAVVMDAARFVPQSRSRLFVIGVRGDIQLPYDVTLTDPVPDWHNRSLLNAFVKLSPESKKVWKWWKMPIPEPRPSTFSDIIEDNPSGVGWHTAEETQRILSMMSPVNLAKVEKAKLTKRRMVGTIYKRTRCDHSGVKVQRAEIRFDDVAGCLRTPAGGSSRQLIMVVDGDRVKSRLISGRETARLMGLPDSYRLPQNYNEAYHLTGDGVVVPVVRHLAAGIFEPVLAAQQLFSRSAA